VLLAAAFALAAAGDGKLGAPLSQHQAGRLEKSDTPPELGRVVPATARRGAPPWRKRNEDDV
jgi:hypothetical protein